ncbi:dimethylarginine dimethylaminohydrolase family protein [Bacillus sp. THAF10]|uniref:dimethylarginine dimethylaminohydrolase family protein n=1 Tax=Bacillus sp. THAF10 TaxID=2587848 RepID=UPI0020A6CF15|nr:dimethylarginine dimethylaminohydrolase family protein [Bacillus sp. THAF10]
MKNTCKNEYNELKKVLVCPPLHMKIDEIINETQKHFAEENIDETLATKQHRKFVDTMIAQGIEVYSLPPAEHFPEQVFTRDIGFTLGEKVFVSHMGSEIRSGEEEILKGWLTKENISFTPLTGNSVEGGDVIIDNDVIYVGISGRTTMESLDALKMELPGYEIIPIPIDKSYLHLDCVFNVISENEAIIYPDAIGEKKYDYLSNRYHLLEVTKEEQFTMGTNVLSIGNKTVISLPCNKDINAKLKMRGYQVLEVDISEIIKSGGSFRCCSMPLARG